MREVIVMNIVDGNIEYEYPDIGIYYDDREMVVVCDKEGLIEVFNAKPVENSDIVLVEEWAPRLNENNPTLVIELLLIGGME